MAGGAEVPMSGSHSDNNVWFQRHWSQGAPRGHPFQMIGITGRSCVRLKEYDSEGTKRQSGFLEEARAERSEPDVMEQQEGDC